ncbi:putative ABC transport system permease protein [Gracilibacillus orientalis]|uniref:Putative ABC transport system permease protein n=1 Tax=Gracilibacillus orientalis TaxID=334253 RepID=A0A1I4NCM2_9BACI|nr:FtsX-like permease family protein [Gracilibacillus orientalis]SFM13274.1 putative ABC transport system permease protein [Gracilibacillus orientalis]
MLVKLLSGSMKKMWKDYLVLLFGLTISIAIFYMFETLAQNQAFLEANALIASIVFVFHVGTFILALVTIFYIFYATSFILSLRQKELGMYMTLGAKKGKVTQMMFLETLVIGIVSLIIGLVFGVGLSEGIGRLLMARLDFSGEGFHSLYPSSLVTTVLFYFVLFLLTAIVNAIRVSRKSVLELLHADQKTDTKTIKGWKTFLGTLFAIVLITVGYVAMINMGNLAQLGVIIAAATVTPGTYFFFMAMLPFLIKRIKAIRSINEKGLNSFTYAQLDFRVSQLTKVLGTVAMLIALGLGAMTAGLSFYHNTEIQSSMMHGYDIKVHQPTEDELAEMENWKFEERNLYSYRVTEDSVYFSKHDLQANPPVIKELGGNLEELSKEVRLTDDLTAPVYTDEETDNAESIPEQWQTALRTELMANFYLFGDRTLYILDQEKFEEINASTQTVLIGKVDNFADYTDTLAKIDERHHQLAIDYTGEDPTTIGSKYENYTTIKSLANGTIFMGLFLGVAFLMMMASVLMFKLLSSATADIERYQMLRKIGVRQAKLKKSIYKELFLVFLFPGLIGLVHVLIGMEMFSFILIEPYTKIWIPISLFLVIYGLYYWLTVKMYQRIVLPKD